MSAPARRWRDVALSKTEALRRLLSDGKPHTQRELARVAGYRYSARLQEIHRHDRPLHYVRLADEVDDSRVLYQRATKSECSVCGGPRRLNARETIRQLRAQVAALREHIEEMSQH